MLVNCTWSSRTCAIYRRRPAIHGVAESYTAERLNWTEAGHGKVEHWYLKDLVNSNQLECVNLIQRTIIPTTKMGEFNSDDHYIYYCGQEFLRGNGVATIVNKRVWNAVLGCNLKNDRMISFPRQIIQQHSNPSLCSHHWCRRSWGWLVL